MKAALKYGKTAQIQTILTLGAPAVNLPQVYRFLDLPWQWEILTGMPFGWGLPRQTVTDITQPLVVLNAPPIHYDIIDGVTYDINKCFDADFRINCEHRSIYENATSSKTEVTTQISSDWGVSQSIEAEVGADFKYIQASVKGSLGRKYGEGFSNVEGSTETVTVKVTSDAIEDDRVYATISNYEILEYPVYANNAREGSVVAVVPKLKGVESLQNTWLGSKSGNARQYIPNHEVGNILSYKESAILPEGAAFFGNGGFEGGGGDTWELSGTLPKPGSFASVRKA